MACHARASLGLPEALSRRLWGTFCDIRPEVHLVGGGTEMPLPAAPVLACPQRLTPVEYSNVKAQLRARGAGGWAHVAWALARRPQLHELELLHARLLALNPKARQPLLAAYSGSCTCDAL